MMNIRKLLLGLIALIFASLPVSAQIEAGKSINITIAGVPYEDKTTINGVYPVSDGGSINMPFLGPVQAAGLRNEQLAASLQSRFKAAGIYTNPTIQVIANTVGARVSEETVMVGGQVMKTGPVAYAKELTLWGAIQAAGGPNPFGSMSRVKLTRNGSEKTYDVTKAQFKQIQLQRNDTIDVPQKNIIGR